MARRAIPITVSVQPEDMPRFNRLVERFGHGNRSAFLRAAMDRMETAAVAAELRELAGYGRERLRELGRDPDSITTEDINEMVRRTLNPPPAPA